MPIEANKFYSKQQLANAYERSVRAFMAEINRNTAIRKALEKRGKYKKDVPPYIVKMITRFLEGE